MRSSSVLYQLGFLAVQLRNNFDWPSWLLCTKFVISLLDLLTAAATSFLQRQTQVHLLKSRSAAPRHETYSNQHQAPGGAQGLYTWFGGLG